MAEIKIEDKEYELRLEYKAVKRMTKKMNTEGQAGLEEMESTLHAALCHHKKFKKMSEEEFEDIVAELVDGGHYTIEQLAKIVEETVAESNFLKKMQAQNEQNQ